MKLLARSMVVAGLLVGVFGGIVGTGGAFIIPVLVYIFKLSQLKAQGTALLIAASPVWIFPFIPYYRAGQYEFRTAALLGAGVAIGGYLGAVLAQHLPQDYARCSVSPASAPWSIAFSAQPILPEITKRR